LLDKRKVLISKELLEENIVEALLSKKGQQIVKLDLDNIQNAFCDTFIVCHAESRTQVHSIAEGVEEQLHSRCNMKPLYREGFENAEWIILVFDSTLLHIFQEEKRVHYKLEELWGDAPVLKIEESFI
jgi:ribosome-associated protein